MQNRRRPRTNQFYGLSAVYALIGVASIACDVAFDAGWILFLLGGLWLVLAACFVPVARHYSGRRRLGFDQALPAAGPDVLTPLRQGRKIEAIKHYRDLNPGIGLSEAKRAVDGLKPWPADRDASD